MRQFYLMSGDDDESLQYVEDYVDREFDDDSVVAKGEFNGPFPDEFKIYVSDGKPADLLANVIGYQIISKRLEKAIRKLVASHTQTIVPPLFLASNQKKAVNSYVLLRFCQAFECVNVSEDPSFDGAIFDPAKIPNAIHILRRTDSYTQAYVSGEFVAAATELHPVGIEFHRLKSL